MKVIALISSLNDREVIGDCIQGLLNQTYPLAEILIVDNGSKDGTSEMDFPKGVTLICHPDNRGTNGTVVTGFKYALGRNYDWMWVFDADSVPREDALEQLIDLYEGFPEELQGKIRLLGSLPVDAGSNTPHHGIVFLTRGITKGFMEVQPDPNGPYYECDSTMWSGSLFNLKAVRNIGLPPENLVLDWGDHEYGYRGMIAGYKTFMSQLSIMRHNLHPVPTVHDIRLGPITVKIHSSPPIRRYYFFRNFFYFWLYEFRYESARTFLLPFFYLLKLSKQLLIIGLFGSNRLPELSASLRGIWDALFKNLDHRF